MLQGLQDIVCFIPNITIFYSLFFPFVSHLELCPFDLSFQSSSLMFHYHLYYFPITNFTDFCCYMKYYRPLLTLGLFYSSIFSFLRWVLRLLILNFPCF